MAVLGKISEIPRFILVEIVMFDGMNEVDLRVILKNSPSNVQLLAHSSTDGKWQLEILLERNGKTEHYYLEKKRGERKFTSLKTMVKRIRLNGGKEILVKL